MAIGFWSKRSEKNYCPPCSFLMGKPTSPKDPAAKESRRHHSAQPTAVRRKNDFLEGFFEALGPYPKVGPICDLFKWTVYRIRVIKYPYKGNS
ncbi:hypothetical protein TNCV_4153721 [Trichonephila clavipes]|nr:hypothetical protein TNCV_4153721 [Trichonephila clavipes]